MSQAPSSPSWPRCVPDRWSYAYSTWFFLRLLGLAYLSAFWSLGVQVRGLVGEQGIVPAAELMASARRAVEADGLGFTSLLRLPTLLWIDASDATLVSICVAGAVLSLFLIAGVAGTVVLPLLWLLYLSLATVSGEFLSFQWDTLLLETGLVAVAVAPWTLVHRPPGGDPPPLSRWLLWWLLFRLMFAAGMVKLTSGDPLWRGLTALSVHYETQPLPTPIGWYAHHLPQWFQEASTAAVLGVELIVPWLVFAPRLLRHAGCAGLIGLQLLIALTGNYAFFNLLTIALSLTLIDDEAWPAWMRTRGRHLARESIGDRHWAPSLVVAAALTLVTIPMTTDMLAFQAGLTLPWHSALRPARRALAPFHSINSYGLFSIMTPTRPEIVVEGSDDGETWKPYEFKYKPGDVRRAPPWVAPHQPRLDWQLWFAAFDDIDAHPWFERLCYRLLEGAGPVTALLAVNPFPDAPPRLIRATLFTYHTASLARHRAEGVWWTREELGSYSPVLSLEP